MARQEAGGSYAGGKRFSAILHFVTYLGFFLLIYLVRTSIDNKTPTTKGFYS
jgi:hypothetical protein